MGYWPFATARTHEKDSSCYLHFDCYPAQTAMIYYHEPTCTESQMQLPLHLEYTFSQLISEKIHYGS